MHKFSADVKRKRELNSLEQHIKKLKNKFSKIDTNLSAGVLDMEVHTKFFCHSWYVMSMG